MYRRKLWAYMWSPKNLKSFVKKPEEKKIYCTAGISYLVMYPNGDVYRCRGDHRAGQASIFNAKNFWKFIEKPLPCHNDRCDSWCDVDWTTKWVFENSKKEPSIIEGQAMLDAELIGKHFINKSMEYPVKNKIHIFWDPTLICNYSCGYCGCGVNKNRIRHNYASSYPELSVEDWMKIWSKIYNSYDFGILTMGGGEPLLSKATLPVIEMIYDKFVISLVTNLSTDIMTIVRSGIKPQPSRFGIIASLHPTSKEFNKDLFFGSLLCLKNNGFNVAVNFVGYPLQLFLAEEYKAWCDKHDIGFIVTPWCGYYNEGFNSIYTEPELNFLNKVTPQHRKIDNLAVFKNYKYNMAVSKDKIEIDGGACYRLKGKVKNTGDVCWNNLGTKEENSFRVGFKIMSYANRREVLKEFRAALPSKDIAPQEEYEFEMNIDARGLKEGIYFAKIDLLKEGSFWFEDKGIVPIRLRLDVLKPALSCEVIEAALPESIPRDIFFAKLKIKNTGTEEWPSIKKSDKIRIGCRVFEESENDYHRKALREFRTGLSSTIKPQDVLEADMEFNLIELPKGKYSLVFDMVKEGEFWFAEIGSDVFKINIELT